MREIPPYNPAATFFPIFRRHWGKMVCTFVMVIGLAVVYTATSPVLYTSEAKLFVRLGRETVALDPTATTGQTVNVAETRENELNSIYEMFKSRSIAEQLVDAFGTSAILGISGPDPSEALADKPDAAVAEVPGPISIWKQINPLTTYSVRDKAIRRLFGRLRVVPVRKSNIIDIACDATDPALAQQLVKKAIEITRSTHMRVNRTAGSFDFFDAQSEEQGRRLAKLEDRWRDLKNRTGIADVNEERTILQRRVATLEDERLRLLAAPAGAQNEAKARGHVALLQRDTPVASLQAQLNAVQEHLSAARAAMPAFHDAEQEIVQLEREIGLEKASFSKNAESRELARIDQAMQETSISNLNILQAPSYSITPTKPRVVLNLALGFVLAVIASSGVAGVAELRYRSPTAADDPLARTTWDIEPFVGTIPNGQAETHHGNGNGSVPIGPAEGGSPYVPR